MISDAKKFFLDIMIKQYFSCLNIFFLQQEIYFYWEKKILYPEEIFAVREKFLYHFIKMFSLHQKTFL